MENESKYARKQRLLAQGAIGNEYEIKEEQKQLNRSDEVAIKMNEEKILIIEKKIVQMKELIDIGKRKAQLYIDLGSTNLADKELTKVVKYEEHLVNLKNAIEKRKVKIENIKKNQKQ